jgi:hypothetical protein
MLSSVVKMNFLRNKYLKKISLPKYEYTFYGLDEY